MNLRIVLILAIVVAAIGGGAYYFGQERKSLQSDAFVGGPLFPGLDQKINTADHLRFESQEGGVVELARGPDGWRMSTHHDYSAHAERVTGLLKRIATLKTLEPKTKKPENHAQLNLDDPKGEFSLATRITVKAGETALADLVAGLNRPPDHGGGAFVRLWGEDQTWLAEGEFKPRRRTLDLLNRDVVNIDGRRIQSARISHPAKQADAGGDAADFVTVGKPVPDQSTYALGAVIPEGYGAKPDHELSAIARIADFLVFEDVRPASEITLDRPIVSVYETFDGVKLTFRAAEQADGNIWATVKAEAGPRWDGLDGFVEANKGQDNETGRIADQFKTAEDVAAEIAGINARVDGWAYKLTDYKADRLTVASLDVIDEVEKPAEAPKAQ